MLQMTRERDKYVPEMRDLLVKIIVYFDDEDNTGYYMRLYFSV